MEEEGVVIEVVGARALVRVAEKGSCESCAVGGACHAGEGARVLEAENRAGAKPGQRVVVELSGGALIKASLVVYMVPVAFLFLGAWVGGVVGPKLAGGMSVDTWQALGGVGFLVLSFAAVRLYGRYAKSGKVLNPVITKVKV